MIGSNIFYEQKKKPVSAKLTLVSLMDIFTILVFFLLLNSGESQRIENPKYVDLPDSSSGISPHTELHILVSGDEILLGEQVVANTAQVLNASEKVIDGLAEALEAYKAQLQELSAYEKHAGLAVTISGDRSVPYSLLQTIMATCQKSNFRNISLAVNKAVGSESRTITPSAAEPVALNPTEHTAPIRGEN